MVRTILHFTRDILRVQAKHTQGERESARKYAKMCVKESAYEGVRELEIGCMRE